MYMTILIDSIWKGDLVMKYSQQMSLDATGTTIKKNGTKFVIKPIIASGTTILTL